MADAKTWVKQMQEQIETLHDLYDITTVEKQVLENELQDTKSASVLLNRQMSILIEMFEEVFTFHKNKPSERTKASMERLMKLMDINTQLEQKSFQNVALQRINHDMFGRIQILRVEKAEIKKQLDNLLAAEQF